MHGSTAIGIVRVARVLTYFVYAVVIINLVILLLGFFLLLFGANPDAQFAEWVYRGLDRVMEPFRGLFKSVPITGNSVLDTSVLFAMIIYSIVGMALHALIDWLTYKLVSLRSREAVAAPPRAPAMTG
jgi:uncharacterized protein YggT (Ycf19 family)